MSKVDRLPMGNHVFICYAREDKDFVLKLAHNLKERGVPVWLDRWDIPHGADWDQSIDEAISECAKFLIVLSPTAVASLEVQGELRTALDEKKPIVPVLYRPRQIPRQLQTVQYVDFATSSPADEAALGQVVRALRKTQPVASSFAEEEKKAAKANARQQREMATPPSKPPSTGKARRIAPWIYGILGGLVMLGGIVVVARDKQPEKLAQDIQTKQDAWKVEPEQPTQRTGKDGKELVFIPAGEFWMGCNPVVDQECDSDEEPGRLVYLDAYSIEKYEVTVAEYRRCVEAGKCVPHGLTTFKSCNWNKEDRGNHPINCVDWNQAQAYCQWVGKRLPTEAEWEKAARGIDRRTYPWGDEWDASKANVGSSGTVVVGSYSSGVSPHGIHDMAGNVWEWVQDWHDSNYYKQAPDRNPTGPHEGSFKVVRGGSWINDEWFARVSLRVWFAPGAHLDLVGFRCAR